VTTIVLLVLALGGLQLFSMSILGDYVGKVLEEVKARPRYIRSRLLRGSTRFESEAEIKNYLQTAREQVDDQYR
jgi:dolichol-phosphate mannosyltransferase